MLHSLYPMVYQLFFKNWTTEHSKCVVYQKLQHFVSDIYIIFLFGIRTSCVVLLMIL